MPNNNPLKKYFQAFWLLLLICYSNDNILSAQTIDFYANCVGNNNLPKIGVDGTGRNQYANGTVEIRFISVSSHWMIYINGIESFHSNATTSPDPPTGGTWFNDGNPGCFTMNQLVINPAVENCTNGIDDDGDLLIDCLDSDCGVQIVGYENGQDASYVFGQDDFTSGAAGTSSTEFRNPTGIAQDPVSGKVFVTDKYNSRVLRFSSPQAFNLDFQKHWQ